MQQSLLKKFCPSWGLNPWSFSWFKFIFLYFTTELKQPCSPLVHYNHPVVTEVFGRPVHWANRGIPVHACVQISAIYMSDLDVFFTKVYSDKVSDSEYSIAFSWAVVLRTDLNKNDSVLLLDTLAFVCDIQTPK